MGNKSSSLKEEKQKGKLDTSNRHSFRKNRKKLKKSITAPLTANGSLRQPLQDTGNIGERGRSAPGTPNLSKHSPAPSNRSYTSPGGSNKLEVKIFRSYTRLNDAGKKRGFLEETPTNIRIYKRSANNSEVELSSKRLASRSYSLPRELCRDRNFRNSGVSSSIENFDNSAVKKTRRSALTSRSSTVSRLNSFSDPSSAAYRVKKSDFTNVETLKKKLSNFAKVLSRCLTESFLTLPPSHLASILPVATQPSPSSSFSQPLITLKELLGASIDLKSAIQNNDSLLCVSKELFQVIQSVKSTQTHQKTSPAHQQTSPNHPPNNDHTDPDLNLICQRMLKATVDEVVWETCRVLEYQISLLGGSLTIESTAKCLSDRITSYVLHQMKTPLIDRNSLLTGLLKGKVHKPQQPPPIASVIIGMKELKWNLYDLMDKAGLRKDSLMEQESLQEDLEAFTYHVAAFSEPMVYGYRGMLMEWDRHRGVYKQHSREKEVFEEEVSYRYDDFHRIYPPHFRAVGSPAFDHATSGDLSKDKSSLTDAFRDLFKGTPYFLDNINVVFYPTKSLTTDWTIASFLNPYIKPPTNTPETAIGRASGGDGSSNFVKSSTSSNEASTERHGTANGVAVSDGFSSPASLVNADETSLSTFTSAFNNHPSTFTPNHDNHQNVFSSTCNSRLNNSSATYNNHSNDTCSNHSVVNQMPHSKQNGAAPQLLHLQHSPALQQQQQHQQLFQQQQQNFQLLQQHTQQQQQQTVQQHSSQQYPTSKPPLSPKPHVSRLSLQQPPLLAAKKRPNKPPPPPRGRSTLSSDECADVLRSSRDLIRRDNAKAVVRSSDLPVFSSGTSVDHPPISKLVESSS